MAKVSARCSPQPGALKVPTHLYPVPCPALQLGEEPTAQHSYAPDITGQHFLSALFSPLGHSRLGLYLSTIPGTPVLPEVSLAWDSTL